MLLASHEHTNPIDFQHTNVCVQISKSSKKKKEKAVIQILQLYIVVYVCVRCKFDVKVNKNNVNKPNDYVAAEEVLVQSSIFAVCSGKNVVGRDENLNYFRM